MRGAESSLDGIAVRGADGLHLIAPGLDQIVDNAAGAVYRGDV